MSEIESQRPVLAHRDELALAVGAQLAWDAFKTFDEIHTWHPGAENCRMLVGENGQPLAVREFDLVGGGFVISELLDYDEARRWFRYRILKTNLPVSNYVGGVRRQRPTDAARFGKVEISDRRAEPTEQRRTIRPLPSPCW
jgi:Polyketide cyclase / dehydrase and lipid transport